MPAWPIYRTGRIPLRSERLRHVRARFKRPDRRPFQPVWSPHARPLGGAQIMGQCTKPCHRSRARDHRRFGGCPMQPICDQSTGKRFSRAASVPPKNSAASCAPRVSATIGRRRMAPHRHRHCWWLYPYLAPHADQRLRQRRRDPSLLRPLRVRLGQLRPGRAGQTFLKRSQRDTLWKGECLYVHLAIAAFRRMLKITASAHSAQHHHHDQWDRRRHREHRVRACRKNPSWPPDPDVGAHARRLAHRRRAWLVSSRRLRPRNMRVRVPAIPGSSKKRQGPRPAEHHNPIGAL